VRDENIKRKGEEGKKRRERERRGDEQLNKKEFRMVLHVLNTSECVNLITKKTVKCNFLYLA
jgi:hypothetical protein